MLTMLKTCLVRQGLEEDGDEGVKVRPRGDGLDRTFKVKIHTQKGPLDR